MTFREALDELAWAWQDFVATVAGTRRFHVRREPSWIDRLLGLAGATVAAAVIVLGAWIATVTFLVTFGA